MTRILISQRVAVDPATAERRDTLDQAWTGLLLSAGLQALPVPNNPAWVRAHLAHPEEGRGEGLLLTGGNSLAKCGGDAPERDEVERLLLAAAVDGGTPVLGVCRGMQVILDFFGGELQRVTGHVTAHQTITIDGVATEANSYHDWGAVAAPAPLQVWAHADDGVVKAVKHDTLPIWGVMWHPERFTPFREADRALLGRIFGGEDRA